MRRRNELIEELRGRIIRGAYPPGSRIPTRAEMVATLGGSTATIQHAFDQLEKEGFLVSRGKFGSYVSKAPPHLSKFGLVQCLPNCWGVTSLYRRNIDHVAKKITRGGDFELSIYEPLMPQSSSNDYVELLKDISSHCIAGIIFAGEPLPAWKDSIMAGALPKAVIGSQPHFYKDLPCVKVETSSFFDLALRDLAEHSRRRPALIMVDDDIARHAGRFRRLAEEAGLQTRPYWEQGVSWTSRINVVGLVRLMFNPGQKQRPDSIIVADDNLLEGVVQGLVESGVSVPDEVRLVCLVNRPILPDVAVEYTALGVSMEDVIGKALDMLVAIRQGRKIQMSEKIDISGS